MLTLALTGVAVPVEVGVGFVPFVDCVGVGGLELEPLHAAIRIAATAAMPVTEVIAAGVRLVFMEVRMLQATRHADLAAMSMIDRCADDGGWRHRAS
jgi:hypothetical protein